MAAQTGWSGGANQLQEGILRGLTACVSCQGSSCCLESAQAKMRLYGESILWNHCFPGSSFLSHLVLEVMGRINLFQCK